MTTVARKREPSLRGTPTFFRLCLKDASVGKQIGVCANTTEPAYATYEDAGWHLGLHLDRELSAEAYEELETLCEEVDPVVFKFELRDLLMRELPGCIALVPLRHRDAVLIGVIAAIAHNGLSVVAENITEEWEERFNNG